jgi:hypothetical protein
MRGRAPFVVILAAATACGSTANVVRTTEQLLERAGDAKLDRAARQAAIKELVDRRDRPIASDLSTIAERHLNEARLSQKPEDRQRASEVGLDVIDALVALGQRSAAVLTLRLTDSDSELVRNKESLARFAKHEDATVRDLAKAKLAAK